MDDAMTAEQLDRLVDETTAAASGVRVAGRTRQAPGWIDLVDPRDGSRRSRVATGGPQDAAEAVEAAAAAAGPWGRTPGPVRAEALRAVAADLQAAAAGGAWARLITTETGKRLAEAEAELSLSATYFRVMADLVQAQEPEHLEVVPGARHLVEASPVGVVAVLTPWNFPVSIPARKLAAALAAGCPVVFKPSEVAPLSGMVLSALLDRHLPEGTVGTVLGAPADVVDPWLAHPALGAVSFTGSTRVGALVARAAAPRFLRTVLELGGCSPFVVLADADPQQAAQTLLVAKYRNNGQSCIAANQVMVAAEVADPFVEAFVAGSQALVVGDPLDAATGLGPLAPAGDRGRMAALVERAVADGARVVSTRDDLPEQGHWAAPTVLVDVPAGSEVPSEEIFGPVTAISTFDDVDDAVAAHLRTGYGLAAYVCGTDTDTALQVAGRLRAGVVGINTGTPNYPGAPFGGVGLSGLGYEGGRHGLEAFQAFRTTAVPR